MEYGKPCGLSGQEVCCATATTITIRPTSTVSTLLDEALPLASPEININNPTLSQTQPEELFREKTTSCLSEEFICVNYQNCVNGFVSDVQFGLNSIRPSSQEVFNITKYILNINYSFPYIVWKLMEFGIPCGSSGVDVCCQQQESPSSFLELHPPTTELSDELLITTFEPSEIFLKESSTPLLDDEEQTEQSITTEPPTTELSALDPVGLLSNKTEENTSRPSPQDSIETRQGKAMYYRLSLITAMPFFKNVTFFP